MASSAAIPSFHPDAISSGGATFIAISSVFTALSAVAVAARFLQRVWIEKIWWDDWLALVSLVLDIGVLITMTIGATLGGAGYHITTYSLSQLEEFLKICPLYNLSLLFSKLSVLCFYHRIFSISKTLRRVILAVGIVVASNCIAAVAGLIFAFSPVNGQWNLKIPSHSIHSKAFWVSIGIINLFLDFGILAIPQSTVWKLNLSTKRRIGLSMVFLLGGFICITTVVRVVYMARINVADIPYQFIVPGIWTCVEMSMSTICACLPVAYTLIKVQKERSQKGSRKSYGSDYTPRITATNDLGSVESSGYKVECSKSKTLSVGSSQDLENSGPVKVKTEVSITTA